MDWIGSGLSICFLFNLVFVLDYLEMNKSSPTSTALYPKRVAYINMRINRYVLFYTDIFFN